MGGTVLHIGAHPDDEDGGLMAYIAHKYNARIVYWSATRGEGGQNQIGPYSGDALGIYRLMGKHRCANGGRRSDALFGPFYDLGFAKLARKLKKNGDGRN